MMRTILALVLATALTLSLATAALCQQKAGADKPKQTHAEVIAAAMKVQPGIPVAKDALIDVGALIGSPVRDDKGNQLGNVGKLIMEPDGRIHYFLLTAASGMLSIGDEVIAVPWKAVTLTHRKDTNQYVVTAAKQTLKPASTFGIGKKMQEKSAPEPKAQP